MSPRNIPSRKVIVTIASIVVLLIVVGVVAWMASAANQKAQEEEQAKIKAQAAALAEKKAKSTEALNISVAGTADGLKLTNVEKDTLTDCKVRLNGMGTSYGYSAIVDSISPTTVVVPWSEFKKSSGFGTVSYNHDKESLAKAVIESCKEQPNRTAVYGN